MSLRLDLVFPLDEYLSVINLTFSSYRVITAKTCEMRKAFVSPAAFVAVLLAVALIAAAQQTKVPRIGVLRAILPPRKRFKF
jgi:hypothetical protein